MDAAHAVITDSGGLQEETTVLGVPCFTVRETTERPVTVLEGTNVMAWDPCVAAGPRPGCPARRISRVCPRGGMGGQVDASSMRCSARPEASQLR